ncbi:probable inactive serine/threonine-protein kinase bub1 [Musca domestica]|uniref:Probable inactive serine/threonine-protein kinase bub1 n=1 Tax=Musca domestica TaxID=7370 RepID=A0A9J7D8J4_MUSDO|nr:probable inactive serine/threonine-protein kinase bub1 [Musca domestica]
MNFDEAKENIQPLAQGRNASILQASLRVESAQELMAQRHELEREIHNYTGDDPLSAWYNYIEWIEQSFPSGGKESGLQEVLAKCLSRFESEEKYNQDRRMIKLYIKYIDNHKDPAECYQQLFNAGIGTMVSDLYIAWAYCYDLVNNTRKADEIFRRGIACRAQPLEELQEAHQHFGFTVAQRLMYKDDDNVQEETNRQIQERRQALSSLRGHRRKQMVGSVRTGTAIKSIVPGTVKTEAANSSARGNVRVQVFKDENVSPNLVVTDPSTESAADTTSKDDGKSVVRSIIDAQREQENLKEPGPWNKPHAKGKLFSKKVPTNELGFEIHEDEGIKDEDKEDDQLLPIKISFEESKFDKPIKLPQNFCSRNRPNHDWIVPVTTEERPDKNVLPLYNKCKMYPRPNVEFQPEELKAYAFFKKRNIENSFVTKRDKFWGRGPLYNVRQFPHFAKQSKPQEPSPMDDFFAPPIMPNILVPYKEIYNVEEKIERSFEEILAQRIRRNETIIQTADMEETICATSEKIQRRKSFFPMRKSIAPCPNRGGAGRKYSIMPSIAAEEDEDSCEAKKQDNQGAEKCLPIFENCEDIQFPKILSKLHATKEPSTEMISKTELPKIFSKIQSHQEESASKPVSVESQLPQQNYGNPDSKDIAKKAVMADCMEKPTSADAKPPPTIRIFEDSVKLPEAAKVSNIVDKPKAEELTSKPVERFEIYQEETSFISPVPKTLPLEAETTEGFQFKTPLPPSTTASQPKSNKLPFEIFEDNGTASARKSPDMACGSGGFFDADETCSTQTFNIFLKAQSVSTPKMKPEPQRIFGNVLKETAPPPASAAQAVPNEEEAKHVNVGGAAIALPEITNDENSPAPATLFSPQRKQLSTILETSEHGTTQSTHTTGATTKSTISSPELDQESQAQAMANTQHQPTLDTVKERTIEDSISPTPPQGPSSSDNIKKVEKQQIIAAEKEPTGRGLEFSIFEDTAIDRSVGQKKLADQEKAQSRPLATPGVARHESSVQKSGRGMGPLNFSIFEDSMDRNSKKQNVGDFSRLEEREDTDAGYVVKPVRFQDDKTETISKMLLAPQNPIKFQEDKTETITKMLMAPPQVVKFQEDKTETISKMLLAPPAPVRFEEDKTETITKFMLAPPQPSKMPEVELLPNLSMKDNSLAASKSQDNFFEFFTQSPPKASKGGPSKKLEKPLMGQLRMAADSMTPVAQNPKRVCDMETPDQLKQKSKPLGLFKESKPSKSVLRDSFIPDFSLTDDSAPPTKPQQTKIAKPKSVLRDTFIPDFSLIEDSQPQQKTSQQKVTNDSFLPDLSHIPETQQQGHDSIIPDSQPMQTSSSSRLKQNSLKPTMQSFLPTFADESMVPDSQPTENSSMRRKQQNSMKSSYVSDYQMVTEKQPLSNSGEGQPASMRNILTDTFMKDFSEIKEPPPMPMDVNEMTLIQPSKNNTTLKLLEETISHKPSESINRPLSGNVKSAASGSGEKLSFLASNPTIQTSTMENKKSSGNNEKYFELNAETEMFGTNISMIKNSTWLPNHGPMSSRNLSHIQEDSLHIKAEELSAETSSKTNSRTLIKDVSRTQTSMSSQRNDAGAREMPPPPPAIQSSMMDLPKPKLSFLDNTSKNIMTGGGISRFSIDVSQSEWAAIQAQKQKQPTNSTSISTRHIEERNENDDDDDYGEMSIYYKQTPKTPKAQVHVWEVAEDDEAFKTPSNNRYMHADTDLNQTQHLIENICEDPHVNPFKVDLINAFLEQIHFSTYIQELTHCMMVRSIHRLKPSSKFKINSVEFEVMKLIGEGAYGAVFCGKETVGGKRCAMKQENPANLWEFYICLEIHDRILVDEMLPAYMNIDYALIGNNSSILISQFSPYGSLITVCNKIKKHTMKNVDEYVVMLMANELLEIIDHLHAVNIIHADIKADNFLLMNKLQYPSKERCIQLIDFGVSIDMKRFKKGQTFSFIHNDNSFKCIEMREQRPWTYQLDLYGLAGVLHVLLFGKYMDVEKKTNGIWMHKTHVPRYFNRNLWDAIFKALLNIRDCNSMPNLQNLRAMLKEEIVEKEKYVLRMVNEFNRALA